MRASSALLVVPLLLIAAAAAAMSSGGAAKKRKRASSADEGHSSAEHGIVPAGRVSSGYGAQRSDHAHAGIDIVAPLGTPVRAAVAGVVVDISNDGERTNYGNLVIVDHGADELTVYAHLQDFAPGLHVGQAVARGALLGHVGKTHAPSTSAMGAHVHFETLAELKRAASGRIIVNRDTLRHEPLAWLERRGGRVSDA